jgi:branched-chain amino acid transport system ATP-binding protein
VAVLEINDLTIRFGGITALDGLSMTVQSGETCAVIGPNGAGKTTLFNAISGIYQPSSGRVTFNGTDTTNVRRDAMVSKGMARTFQNLALFPRLSVFDNVMLGAHAHSTAGFAACAFRSPRARRQEREAATYCRSLLDDLGIGRHADHVADGLPFGTLKRVELARALAARPKLLMLDEPAAGLTHGEVDELIELIGELKAGLGLTIVLVEHHMNLVMSLSDRVFAMNFGKLIASGRPDEVAVHPAVVEAYLGSRS